MINRLRRWLRRALGRDVGPALTIVSLLLIGVAVYTTMLIQQRERALQAISRYNATWTASQAAAEVARLQVAVGAYAAHVDGVTRDEVQLRLDIVLNRVQLLSSGELAKFVQAAPGMEPIVFRLRQAVDAAQPLVGRLDEPGSAAALLALFMPLNAQLTHVASGAYEEASATVASGLDSLRRLHRVVSGVLVLLVVLVLGLCAWLAWHNRSLLRAHARGRRLVGTLQAKGRALRVAIEQAQQVTRDAQEKNQALQRRDQELRSRNAHFDAALNNMSHALVMGDADMRLLVFNARFVALFGLDAGAIHPGLPMSEIVRGVLEAGRLDTELVGAVWDCQRELVLAGQRGSFSKVGRDGRALSVSHQPMADGGWVTTYEDITERRQAETRIAFMAAHDSLTGLANRRVFQSRLADALASLPRAGGGVAVHCVDLDHFKAVNDTCGHRAGDVLLEAVARRLSASVLDTDVVARLGGDEFAVLQAVSSPGQAQELARRVLDTICESYDLAGWTATVGASIGIAISMDGAGGADRLLNQADLALYHAKASGRRTFCLFEPAMEAERSTRLLIETDLRAALGRKELQVHYQPVYGLARDEVTGFEALLRWPHPIQGAVPPAVFIPIAEESGLITEIGEWVLRHACEHAVTWPHPVKVAVNLSPTQFGSDRIIRAVSTTLAACGLAPHRLELEITESVLLRNDERVLAILRQLRELGVRIVLDDFGTGYSSLSYLRRFPFDKVKVDRTFVHELDRPDCGTIVEFVVNLAHQLGMTTTAEGVETKEQLRRLRELGYDEVQGDLLGRPAPETSFGSDGVHAPRIPARAGREAATG